MSYAPPRSRRTTLTAVLIVLVTIPFVLSAIDLARVAFGSIDQDTTLRLVSYQWDPADAGFFLQLAAVVVAGLCAWCVLLAVGILARLETSRMAGLLTFAGLGMISSMLALGALVTEQRPEGWLLSLVVAAVNVTIVVLLWSTEVADDISRGAHARRRRRTAGQRQTVAQ